MRNHRFFGFAARRCAGPRCPAQRGFRFIRTQFENHVPGRPVDSGEQPHGQIERSCVRDEFRQRDPDAADSGELLNLRTAGARSGTVNRLFRAIRQPDGERFGRQNTPLRSVAGNRDPESGGIDGSSVDGDFNVKTSPFRSLEIKWSALISFGVVTEFRSPAGTVPAGRTGAASNTAPHSAMRIS